MEIQAEVFEEYPSTRGTEPKNIGGDMGKEGQRKLRMTPKAADFKEIFETHYAPIFRWTAYLLDDLIAAEDVAQDTFIRLLYSPPKEETNIAGWLKKAAANLAFNYLRSEKQRREREVKSKALEQNSRGSAEDDLLEIEGLAEVRSSLNQLEARDRLCLLLKASGYSYEEISEVICVKKSSVGTLLVRAQAKFKKIYSGEKEGGVKDVLQRRRTSSLS